MREMPANQLNPRIKSVCRINDAIWIVVSFLCCFLPFAIIALVAPEEAWAGVVALIVAILFVALLVLCVVVLPPIRYARWRYELTPDYLDMLAASSGASASSFRSSACRTPTRAKGPSCARSACPASPWQLPPASTRFPASASKRPTCCAIVPPSWRVWPERTYK